MLECIFSSMEIHSGTFHCPGMDLAGTQDIFPHSGTVPGNPGQLVTLLVNLSGFYVNGKSYHNITKLFHYDEQINFFWQKLTLTSFQAGFRRNCELRLGTLDCVTHNIPSNFYLSCAHLPAA